MSRADGRFLTSAPEPGPWPLADVSLRGEARLMELDLRLLAEAETGPGNSELVEQEEKEELLCFLPTQAVLVRNVLCYFKLAQILQYDAK